MPKIDFRVNDGGNIRYVSYDENMIVEDFMKDYLSKYIGVVSIDLKMYTFKVNVKVLNSQKFRNLKLKEVIRNNGIVHLFRKQNTHYSGGYWLEKRIYIKFLKISNTLSEEICYSD